jgi:GNAT superfamily N-acetyltransferase
MAALERISVRRLARRPTPQAPVRGPRGATGCGIAHVTRFDPTTLEYQVRAARITDIDRLVALFDEPLRALRAGDVAGPLDAADLLRQLVNLPQATILVAETRRELAGGAVLALRPSVRAGGFVGTVDLLAVDPRHDADRVTDVLVEEILRSARNKGCVAVEAVQPDDPEERARWDRLRFRGSGPRIERRVAVEPSSARRY